MNVCALISHPEFMLELVPREFCKVKEAWESVGYSESLSTVNVIAFLMVDLNHRTMC